MTGAEVSERPSSSCKAIEVRRLGAYPRLTIIAIFVLLAAGQCLAQGPVFAYEKLADLPADGSLGLVAYGGSNLVEIKPGIFVGTADEGGLTTAPCPSYGCGTIYQIDTTTSPATLSLLHAFAGSETDGLSPEGRIDWDGKFVYGTTYNNFEGGCLGAPFCGTIYRFDPSLKKLTTIWTMHSADPDGSGVLPVTGVLYDGKNGHLYGTTDNSNPASGLGTVFDYASPATVAIGTAPAFYQVPSAIGYHPQALMLYSHDGNLYATTGGYDNLFQFNTAFPAAPTKCGDATGYGIKVGQLAEGTDGALYGVAKPGSPSGVVYRADISGGCSSTTFATVHDLSGTEGIPMAGLLASSNGMLYGTAGLSGTDQGTFYSVAPSTSDTFQLLYTNPKGATGPTAELTEGKDGWLYGIYHYSHNPGSIFRLRSPRPPLNILQFGTANVFDAGGPIAVDARPSVVPPGDKPPLGPRIYIAGESASNLAPILGGGQGSGGFFLARYFQDGTLDKSFGATTIGGSDGGVLQFGPSTVGPGKPDYVAAVAVDNSGNVLLTGSTTAGVFTCTNNQGGADIWAVSFSPSGGFQWCKMFGSTKDDSAQALTLDTAGNLYVNGSTTGSLPGNTLVGTTDAFIAKIAPKGSHLTTIHQFAQDGQDVTTSGGIAYCGGNLYLSINAGPDFSNQSGWISKFSAANLVPVAGATQQLAAGYGAVPVATDSTCKVYLGAGFFATSAGNSQEFFALQEYNSALSKMLFETDGPARTAEGSQVLYPESILALAVDKTNSVYAGGGTNFSLYGLPLPAPPQAVAPCDIVPLNYCAGWFAVYDPTNKLALFGRSPQEFGDVETGLSGLAVDEYGTIHTAGETVGPLVKGGEFDNSIDGFEMDFSPAPLCNGSPCPPRTTTNTTLTGSATTVAHGGTVTFTAAVKDIDGGLVRKGLVTFISDGFAAEGYTVLGTFPVSTAALKVGTATLKKAFPKAGTYNIIAVYGGTTTLAPSNSKTSLDGADFWMLTVQ